MLRRAQADRLIDEAADLDRVRRVYYALLRESLHDNADGADPDVLAARTSTPCCRAPAHAPEHLPQDCAPDCRKTDERWRL
ncbi:TetR family transcriptional regulator [Streptomyces pristinaespiralis]|nr:TetR family transcriptional regulator [Streptomyces pristinaespiralis]